MSAHLGSLRFRLVLASLYLVVPNCRELLDCITESQWVLALCALLILLGAIPRHRKATVTLYITAMLTGPFCIFLLPFAVWVYLRQRTGWKRFLLALTLGGAVIQGGALLLFSDHRLHPQLGATVPRFLQILGGQMYLGSLFGINRFGWTFSAPFICFTLLATVFFIWAYLRMNVWMRAVMLFSATIFLVSLAKPTIVLHPGQQGWEILAMVGGIRYWFFPCLAFVWAIVVGLFSESKPLNACSCILAILLLVGVGRGFYHPDWRGDPQFPHHAQQFAQMHRGQTMTIPIRPRGWKMVLTRH